MQSEKIGCQGYPPIVAVDQGNPEAIKYGKLWEFKSYRISSPGEVTAQVFLEQAKPKAEASVIDFGCGTGRGGLMLALFGNMNVTMMDFVNNCLDKEIKDMLITQSHKMRFIKADLEKPIPVASEYGYCTDVMEHIPPDKVDIVLNNILQSAQHVFFRIATGEDNCGTLIGEELHLSQHPFSWWLEKFNQRECIVHWSQDTPHGYCLFYVTAWIDGQSIVDVGVLNTEEEIVKANVRYNIQQGWEQVSPHVTNDIEVMILGGGPSMAEYEDEIKKKRSEGVKLITLNGAYNWALEHGLIPSAQVMVDARQFNARFTKPVIDDCKYLISSQCDPTVFEGLPKERTYIWHTSAEFIRDILNEQYDVYWAVPGGSTVLLRAIPLLRMLGFKRFHLYGCDSCLTGNTHHIYAQSENDEDMVVPVNVGGRTFYCSTWMISQAQEFVSMIKYLGNEIELEVYGDGLLSHILLTGASLLQEEG